jgi:hypothetical protein
MLPKGKSKKQIISDVCKMFKVRYRLVKRSINWGHAEVDIFNEIIYINMNSNKVKNEFVSSLLHEICHIIASRQGKYEVYHKDKTNNDKNKRIFLKTALSAELYVEKQAQYLMKMFFPGMRYVKSYHKKEDIEWLNNVFLKDVRKGLKKTKKAIK